MILRALLGFLVALALMTPAIGQIDRPKGLSDEEWMRRLRDELECARGGPRCPSTPVGSVDDEVRKLEQELREIKEREQTRRP